MSSTCIRPSSATRRLSALTTLRVPRCNDANIDIVTSYTNLFPFFARLLLPSSLKKKKRKEGKRSRKRERETHRSKYNQKEEARESLFTLPMTELIETTRSGTRFSIFKGASSGAFLRYFCRRRRGMEGTWIENWRSTEDPTRCTASACRCTRYRAPRMSRGEKCQASVELKPGESEGNSRLRRDEMVK